MPTMINLRSKANRTDPLAWLAAADQLDEAGEDGSAVRRQGYLLQAVFDLVMPEQRLTFNDPPIRIPRGTYPGGRTKEKSHQCYGFGLYARFCGKTIWLSIWPRSSPLDASVRVQTCLYRSCLVHDGKRNHGLDYLMKATLRKLAELDRLIAAKAAQTQ